MTEAPGDIVVGIVVPFTSWNPLVEECVRGCLDLDYGNFKLALMPNEGEALPAWVSEDPRIIVAPTPVHGISFKRNTGFRVVGDVACYALIDSDARPEPQWLTNALKIFEKDPGISIVTGPNISPDYQSPLRRAVTNALHSPLVLGSRAFMKRRAEDRYTHDPYGCNMIIKKDAIDAVGGFNETLKFGEDSELNRRIGRAGGKLFFSGDVVVFHHNRPLFMPFIKQRMFGGQTAPSAFMRDPCFAFALFLLPAVFIVFAAVGWVMGFVHPVGYGLWLLGIAMFFLVTIIEAIRHAKTAGQIPLTWIALIIGNLAPGVGSLIALMKMTPGLVPFHTNYTPGNNPD
ncbi:MAG: glycosyltransferase [Rhodospirillales bacterium]